MMLVLNEDEVKELIVEALTRRGLEAGAKDAGRTLDVDDVTFVVKDDGGDAVDDMYVSVNVDPVVLPEPKEQ